MIDSTSFFVLEDFETQINKTYTFNFPIEEVYKAFTDRDLILKLFPYQFHLYNLLGETFIEDEGNEISIIIKGKERLVFKIIKVTKSQNYYQIRAKTIQHPLEYVPFTIQLEFFWDTIKEATIFNGQIKVAKTNQQLKFISDFKKMNIFPLEEIDEYLKNNVKNLEQNESILVNVSIDKLWDFCKQMKNIQLFISLPNTEIINEGNNIIKLVDKNNNKHTACPEIMIYSPQFSSVAQSCPTLRPHESQHARPPCPSPTPEFTQTQVHRVRDAIQPSHPRSSPSSPAPNPSQH